MTKKVTPGYINTVRKGFVSITAVHLKTSAVCGFRNIAEFAEQTGFDKKDIYRAIHEAFDIGEEDIEYEGWIITPRTSTQLRQYLTSMGIKLATEMKTIYGKVPVKINGWAKEDKPFAKAMVKFQGRFK